MVSGGSGMRTLMFVAVASFMAKAVLASYYPWHGYAAHVVVTPQGYLADTPEVAAAKAAHFAEVAKAGGIIPYGYGGYTPVVTPEGFLADTPEVAAAKAAHFAEVAKAGGVIPYGYGSYTPVVTHEGYLADTPEVAAAKVAHFAEHAKAAAGAAGVPFPHYYPYAYPYAYSTYGVPVVTPDGYLADTPEVAAAKVAHFAEHAKASHG